MKAIKKKFKFLLLLLNFLKKNDFINNIYYT